MPAENQIILPTPVTKVRSIWPVLSNDKVKVKIRPLNKIVAHRGSETFEITSPSPPTTTKTTTTTKPPQIDNSKKSKNNYVKTKNKLENLNDIKGKKKLLHIRHRVFSNQNTPKNAFYTDISRIFGVF